MRAVNPRHRLLLDVRLRPDGPARRWAGHDLNYLALGGYLDCSGRAPGGAAAAGRDDRRRGRRRHARGDGDPGRAAAPGAPRARARYLDVSIADGVLSLMSLYVDEYLATGAEPGPGHYILTGRYACYDVYRCADGRWVAVGAIEPHFCRNLCRLLGCEQWVDHQTDDDVQDEMRADFAAAFAREPRDEWVAELAPADTCVAPVYTVAELVAIRTSRRAGSSARRPARRRRPHVPPGRHRAGRHRHRRGARSRVRDGGDHRHRRAAGRRPA